MTNSWRFSYLQPPSPTPSATASANGSVKADQKARGRYLGGKVPFGFRRGDDGELVPHKAEQEAIREMIALLAQGKPLRPSPPL
jgi:hypothetical protein